MGRYVIKREEDGAYATRPGYHSCSYTRDIRKAWKFDKIEDARGNCCGNEYAVALEDELLA
jgi:hypothetical protein